MVKKIVKYMFVSLLNEKFLGQFANGAFNWTILNVPF